MPIPEPVPASHFSAAAKKRSAKKQRRKRVRKSRGGVPPPLPFALESVAGSALLSVVEVAAAVRRNAQTVRLWRSQPDHPLKFRTIDGRPMTTVADVLRYLNTAEQVSRSKR